MTKCPHCLHTFSALGKHLSRSPPCRLSQYPPPPPLEADLEEDDDAEKDIRVTVAHGLAKLLVRHGCHHTAVQEMIAMTNDVLAVAQSNILSEVRRLPGSSSIVARIETIIAERLKLYEGLDTPHKQMKFIKKIFGPKYVEPSLLFLGERTYTFEDEEGTIHTYKEQEAHAVTFDLVAESMRVMEASDIAYQHVVDTSSRWRVGTRNLPKPTALADITDGTNFLEHPLLVDPEDDDVLIIALMLSADAVETCNPVGVARGKHKIVGMLFSLLNLPSGMRTRKEYIGTAMLALNDDMKFYGATHLLGGCDSDLEPIAGMEASVGAQLRRYSTPVPVTVRGKQWRLKIVPVLLTADFEAQGLFGFESESAHAHSLCRLCLFNKSVEGAYTKPTDYISKPGRGRGRKRSWPERTAPEVEALMAELRELREQNDAQGAEEFSTRHGIFSSGSPFHSKVTPGFNIVDFRPQDVMHLIGCGLGLRDASEIVHWGVKKVKAFDVPKLNGRLARCAPPSPPVPTHALISLAPFALTA